MRSRAIAGALAAVVSAASGEEMPATAPGASVREAMRCIQWDAPWVKNTCRTKVLVQWCFKRDSGHPVTCGAHARPHHSDPDVKTGHYTHAMELVPGAEMRAPWTDERSYWWVACPAWPASGRLFYAAAVPNGKFRCIRVERRYLDAGRARMERSMQEWNRVEEARFEREMAEEEREWRAQRRRDRQGWDSFNEALMEGLKSRTRRPGARGEGGECENQGGWSRCRAVQ